MAIKVRLPRLWGVVAPNASGKLKPKKTKTIPFKVSLRICHRVVVAIWTLADVKRNRSLSRLCMIPAATTAKIPEQWSSSANQ